MVFVVISESIIGYTDNSGTYTWPTEYRCSSRATAEQKVNDLKLKIVKDQLRLMYQDMNILPSELQNICLIKSKIDLMDDKISIKEWRTIEKKPVSSSDLEKLYKYFQKNPQDWNERGFSIRIEEH